MDKKIYLGLYAALIFLAYIFLLGKPYFEALSWVITFSVILLGMYYGYDAVKFFGITSLQGKSLLFLFLMIASAFIADIIQLLFLTGASVSLADFFFMLWYPFFSVGIFMAINLAKPDFLKSSASKIAVILATAVFVYLYFKFFPLTWNSEISQLENFVASGYVIGDFIILLFVIFLLYSIAFGTFSYGWLSFGAGACFTFAGDILYAMNFQNYTLSGQYMDTLYYFGYLMYALGFIIIKENAQKAMDFSSRHKTF